METRKLHLICNAHLDPVWLWQWQEGAAEAVSTFRVAADFCEAYDGFVFNHNEALLYEWIEEFEPALFARIQKLAAAGKWNIMGGWYLQPDCMLPSGDSFVRQIVAGRRYFREKFGVEPSVAMNVDPFGHTRGLVQILAKTGFDGYLFMRPDTMEAGDFLWEGFDGSRVTGHKIYGSYNTYRGQAAEKVKKFLAECGEGREKLLFWGVGDHGGGPSRVDLENINVLAAQTGGWEFVHSTPETYFRTVDPSRLRVVSESIGPCMIGCYTTMARIKQEHRALENELARSEKMASHAAMACGAAIEENPLREAERALLLGEFHDILPGTMIRRAEEDSLRLLAHGRELCGRVAAKAFFVLAAGQAKAKEGEIPILVYNPHPYPIETDVEVEFQLADQNWNEDECTVARVRGAEGAYAVAQNEKEDCTFSLDWRKKIVFHTVLAPSSMSRYDCELEAKQNFIRVLDCPVEDGCFVIEGSGGFRVAISRETGLLRSFVSGGREMLAEPTGVLVAFDDDEDPWGMRVDSFCQSRSAFQLMEDADAFAGNPRAGFAPVRVVENGPVRTKIQAFFEHGPSRAVVTYIVSKLGGTLDADILLFSNEANKMIKYELATSLAGAEFWGQASFGAELMEQAHRETAFQQWCGFSDGINAFAVLNTGTYAGSADGGVLRLSLCRTAAYATHPIDGRPLAPQDRWLDHIDMGERRFSFRVAAGAAGDMRRNVGRMALEYNQKPYVLPFFPPDGGKKPLPAVELSGPDALLTALTPDGGGRYRARIYNASANACPVKLAFPALGASGTWKFGPFEAKTFIVTDGAVTELERWDQ